jgi:hypothetical protein
MLGHHAGVQIEGNRRCLRLLSKPHDLINVHQRLLSKHVIELIPIDPTSMGRLMPRNMLTPTPSSAHSSAKVRQNWCRGANRSFCFSVPWDMFSGSKGSSAPSPIVGNRV